MGAETSAVTRIIKVYYIYMGVYVGFNMGWLGQVLRQGGFNKIVSDMVLQWDTSTCAYSFQRSKFGRIFHSSKISGANEAFWTISSGRGTTPIPSHNLSISPTRSYQGRNITVSREQRL